MGFWTLHSGGERFYETAADDELKSAGHRLSVFNLDVSWAMDDDPECRETEELKQFGNNQPVLNKKAAKTCNREDCLRRKNLLGKDKT